MRRVDSFLLDAHQRASDVVNDATGRDCFRQASLMVWVFTILCAWAMLLSHEPYWLITLTAVLQFAVFRIDTGITCVATKILGQNPTADDGRWFRYFFIATSAFFLLPPHAFGDRVYVVARLAFVIWCYLVACTPRPPKKRRKLKDVVSEKLRELMEPAPQPEPVRTHLTPAHAGIEDRS